MNAIYVGDVGTELVVDCGVDISAATVTKLSVRKPTGVLVEWNASLKGTNQLSKIAQLGDLDVAGVYLLQAKITMPGWSGLGQTAQFTVSDPFDGLS